MDISENLATKPHPTNIRFLFHLVTPNETIYPTLEAVPNIADRVYVWMVVLVLLELLFIRWESWALNDTVTSMNAGMWSQLFKLGGRSMSAYFYTPLFDRLHIVDLPPDSPYTWFLCFFTQDLAYYLAHRVMHEVAWFWSFHQMHHSSEYYNLSNGLRQSAIEDLGISAFDLLQVFFIPPNIWMAHRYLNLLFQFWLHTELVSYLGPLEYFFNTPSSHRVHRGRNPYCIDKNYGGTMIMWDRLFGTYARERSDEKIAYGLVNSVNSFDQLWLQLFKNKALIYDKGQMKNEKGIEVFPGFWNKVKAAWWPPGYLPGYKTKQFFWWRPLRDSSEGVPEIIHPVKIYNPPLPFKLKVYLVVQMTLFAFVSLTELNEFRPEVTWFGFFVGLALLLAMMQKFGYYFDRRPCAVTFDLILSSMLTFVGYWENIWFLTLFGWMTIVTVLLIKGEWKKSNRKVSEIYVKGENCNICKVL